MIERVFLVDPGGTLVADTPALPGVRGVDFSFRDWYRGVSRNWKPYVSGIYRRTAEPRCNVFAVAVPIKGPELEVSGILVLQVRAAALLQWVDGIDVSSSGVLYLVDPRGRIAAHPGYDPDGDAVDFSNVIAVGRALQGERGVDVLLNSVEGEMKVSGYEPVPGYGWGVVTEQAVDSAFAKRDRSLNLILLAYGVILLISGGMTCVIACTIDERRRGEEKIGRLNESLRQRAAELDSSNGELEAFGYSVSHDLRAPLRHIVGFVELLERHASAALEARGRGYLEKISAAAKRMGLLIDDLLSFSRMGRQEMQQSAIDLGAMARDVASGLEANGRKIDWHIEKLPQAQGDSAMLRLVMENLIGNAVKYTSTREQPRIEVSASEGTDGETIVRVRDNGVGFDMKYAHKLFGVFQRLHRTDEFEGTGIGLANVRRIIARHGGRAWAEGAVGGGAAFYFSLPGRRGGS